MGEVFRDYGFVEQPPSFWWFQHNSVRYSFTLQAVDEHLEPPVVFPAGYNEQYLKDFTAAAQSKLQESGQVLLAEQAVKSPHADLALRYRRGFNDALGAA